MVRHTSSGNTCESDEADADSSEVFERPCETCEEGNEIEAIGYCQQCEQYLCRRCRSYHKNMVLTKQHHVIGKEEFCPKQTKSLFGRKIIPSSVITISPYLNCGLNVTAINNMSFLTDTDTIVVTSRCNKTSSMTVIPRTGEERKICDSQNADVSMVQNLRANKTKYLFSQPLNKTISVVDLTVSSYPSCVQRVFSVAGECWGFAEFDQGYAVSVRMATGFDLPDWQVQYLDIKGNLKRQIYYDNHGNSLFSKPLFLASNNEQDVLFVSDTDKHCIFALNVVGEVVFRFSHANVIFPEALAVDGENNLFVTCADKILHVYKDGTKHNVILQHRAQSVAFKCVAFDKTRNVLSVSDGSDKISTFNFQT